MPCQIHRKLHYTFLGIGKVANWPSRFALKSNFPTSQEGRWWWCAITTFLIFDVQKQAGWLDVDFLAVMKIKCPLGLLRRRSKTITCLSAYVGVKVLWVPIGAEYRWGYSIGLRESVCYSSPQLLQPSPAFGFPSLFAAYGKKKLP